MPETRVDELIEEIVVDEQLKEQNIKEKLLKIPVLNIIIKFLSKIKLPGFEGLSLYDLLELYVIGIAKGALTARASAIAYSFFTALFPFLLFIIIIIPSIPMDGFETDFLAFLESVLPPTTTDFFHENIFETLKGSNNNTGLLSTVLIVAVFLMANGVNALFSGFENSYHEQLTRNPFKQYFFAMGVALILSLLLILTVAVLGYFQIYVVDNTLAFFREYGYESRRKTEFWASIAQYAFFVIVTFLATATLYYLGTREGRKAKFFSVGAFFTTILIMLTSYLFGVYIENFSRYNELYGSIGALLILLFYLWLNANILLLGFELNMSIMNLKKQHSYE
ncbi:membrane protein [Lacinutrix venerupis]|uniref:YihY/virulence factor BrkB family protein n=1 Tax=Lacinutrix venerupis TaxID=1486034 RepID=UPI000EABC3EE|nr:YihY/virulence factor BrkB family protein [Lacinutrix venerupis]RLJ62598.1 membrane protein [Lacinutrix venerupis]